IPEIIKNLTTIKIIPFTINFTSTGAFPNRKHPRVLWIGLLKGMHTLNELSVKIDDMMNLLGFPSNSKAFNPHVTVARTKKPFPNAIKLFNDFYSYFSINSDCPFSLVTKFFLKKSTLTPKGPIYEDLHVFV
ncbi:MAG: RNA 2',3'-cyclic phosphodiesterase, partial [Candidatus Thorarchaeota archaeon]